MAERLEVWGKTLRAFVNALKVADDTECDCCERLCASDIDRWEDSDSDSVDIPTYNPNSVKVKFNAAITADRYPMTFNSAVDSPDHGTMPCCQMFNDMYGQDGDGYVDLPHQTFSGSFTHFDMGAQCVWTRGLASNGPGYAWVGGGFTTGCDGDDCGVVYGLVDQFGGATRVSAAIVYDEGADEVLWEVKIVTTAGTCFSGGVDSIPVTQMTRYRSSALTTDSCSRYVSFGTFTLTKVEDYTECVWAGGIDPTCTADIPANMSKSNFCTFPDEMTLVASCDPTTTTTSTTSTTTTSTTTSSTTSSTTTSTTTTSTTTTATPEYCYPCGICVPDDGTGHLAGPYASHAECVSHCGGGGDVTNPCDGTVFCEMACQFDGIHQTWQIVADPCGTGDHLECLCTGYSPTTGLFVQEGEPCAVDDSGFDCLETPGGDPGGRCRCTNA
jgi:hypothetical protein